MFGLNITLAVLELRIFSDREPPCYCDMTNSLSYVKYVKLSSVLYVMLR